MMSERDIKRVAKLITCEFTWTHDGIAVVGILEMKAAAIKILRAESKRGEEGKVKTK